MDDFEKKLVSGTGWKIVATIMAFVWILNIFTTWFGVKGLKMSGLLTIIVFIVSIIFWIPGTILSLKYIWLDN